MHKTIHLASCVQCGIICLGTNEQKTLEKLQRVTQHPHDHNHTITTDHAEVQIPATAAHNRHALCNN